MPDEPGNAGDAGANGNGSENKAGETGNAPPDTKAETDKEKTNVTESPKLSFTQEELDAIIEKRVNRATKKVKDDANLSETDRLKKENAELKKGLAESALKDKFTAKAGIDAAKGGRLFRMYKDEFEFDDTGKCTNLDSVLKEAKTEWPELFTKPKGGADGAAGNESGGNANSMNAILRGGRGRS